MATEFMDVFTVIETKDKPDFWLKIGRAFPHKNGDGGFNIVLNALPLDNKLIVKPHLIKTTEGIE